MKIIEAMRKVKEHEEKAADLRAKVQRYCADLSLHTPAYEDQGAKVRGWLQAHEDLTQEICRLKTAIQRTNVTTLLTIELGDKQATKSIASWIYRRRTLAKQDLQAWQSLTDRGLQEGSMPGPTPDAAPQRVTIRRYWDPVERDKKQDLFAAEPRIIDGKLEVANAVTDLIEN